MKIDKKTSVFKRICSIMCHFCQIPYMGNVIDRQRMFVFLFFSMYGFLSGTFYLIFHLIHPFHSFIAMFNAIHICVIVLLAIFYLKRLVSLYRLTMFLILFCQIEIAAVMLFMAKTKGEMLGIEGILTNVTLSSINLLLSMAAYIRFLPYIQTLITLVVLCICANIMQSNALWQLIPTLGLVFVVLSILGDRLIVSVQLLHVTKQNLDKEQSRIFEFLNMNKEELFKLINLTQRKKLTEKQKGKLLELLDEQTKTSVLEVAVEVVEKKKRNLTVLGNRELGLTPYEKEVCLLILKEMTVADIARKLGKTSTSITSVRALIRGKLKLAKEDNLYEALKLLVSEEEA